MASCRIQSERCRNIGLELLSSRVGTKKTLLVGTGGSKSKWTASRARVKAVLDEAMANHDGALEVLADQDRWVSPSSTPSADLPSKADVVAAQVAMDPRLQQTPALQ